VNRADGTRLRHQSTLGLGPQTVVGGRFRKQPTGHRAARLCMAAQHTEGKVDVETTTDPKANVVVTVVGIVPVAVGAAAVVTIVVPRPAPQHPRLHHRQPHRRTGQASIALFAKPWQQRANGALRAPFPESRKPEEQRSAIQ